MKLRHILYVANSFLESINIKPYPLECIQIFQILLFWMTEFHITVEKNLTYLNK